MSSCNSSEILPTGIEIRLNPGQSTYLYVGSYLDLEVNRIPRDNTASIVVNNSNPTVCSVVDTTIHGLAVGTCDITFSYDGYPNISATIAIKVVSVGSFRIVLPSGVDPTFLVDEGCQLYAMVEDEVMPCFWWSSDNEILLVSNQGYITAMQVGVATVTAWGDSGYFSDELEITIVEREPLNRN